MGNKQAKIQLLTSRSEILKHLREIINKHSFNYKTFGTEIENYVYPKLIEIFTESGFIAGENDYRIAENKNIFPDFILLTRPPLAIDIKSGNRSKKSKGKWVTCKNSNNDMGTLNMWEKKLAEFGGKNIFYLFIEYNFNDHKKEIVTIKIKPFYRFLGLNREGLLKYREKDGNLRPKDFDAPSPIKTLEQFEPLLSKTIIFRSKRITKKHLLKIPKGERKEFLESLKDQ